MFAGTYNLNSPILLHNRQYFRLYAVVDAGGQHILVTIDQTDHYAVIWKSNVLDQSRECL